MVGSTSYQLPPDINQAFVIGSESSLDSDFHFRIVFSTRKMLGTLPTAKEVYIDTAHWLGFPFMVFGANDHAGRFTPFAHAICSKEDSEDFKFIFDSTKNSIKMHINVEFEPDTLLAEGETLILVRNAFHASFGSDVQCTPWSNRSIDAYIAKIKHRFNYSMNPIQLMIQFLATITQISEEIQLQRD